MDRHFPTICLIILVGAIVLGSWLDAHLPI